jgi:hypothetical protein
MEHRKDDLVAYRIGHQLEVKLEVAHPGRDWMNRSNRGYANRCLPMRIADQAGWVLLNDRPMRAKWLGKTSPDSIVFERTGDPPYTAISHFGEGILTFTIPYLFRSPPGTALLFRGPANSPKNSIAPLEAFVETDWAVAPATMNWKFTQPDSWVEFQRDEPFCMIVPHRFDLLETMRPRILDIEQNPAIQRLYSAWCESCRAFSARLRRHDPEAMRLGWQRYYFRGTAPHAEWEASCQDGEHRTRLNLRKFAEHQKPTCPQGLVSGDLVASIEPCKSTVRLK